MIEEGILMMNDMDNSQRLVLPKSLRGLVYQHLHVDMGHIGAEKVYLIAKPKFYWPGMENDITDFINGSCPCLVQRKPHSLKKAPLQPIVTTVPMELVAIDFMTTLRDLLMHTPREIRVLPQ